MSKQYGNRSQDKKVVSVSLNTEKEASIEPAIIPCCPIVNRVGNCFH